MRTIRVDLGPRSYDIVVGAAVLAGAPVVLPGRARVAVVSQPAVAERYAAAVVGALEDAGTAAEVFLIDDGEEAKSLPTVESLC
ncbi:MAG TPA: 3-dehydroquinate synthase, partial [Acidimicrobiia bacterium]|nr:3-dehydroquinate synthase [Acidimicrobiia bacterium]